MLLRVVRCVAMTIVLSLLSLPVLSADGGPAQSDCGRKPLAEVAVHVAAILDLGAARVEVEARLEQGLPFRYAVAERVTLGPDNADEVLMVPDLVQVHRVPLGNERIAAAILSGLLVCATVLVWWVRD